MTRTEFLRCCIAAFAAATLAPAGAALAGPLQFRTPEGWAIRGYDPVAYFKDGRPEAGHPEIAEEWNGAIWLFATEANRETFRADPARYAPQYGGYCAYAVANGYTASIDPEAWRIVGGKLYLNYSKEVRDLWDKDVPGYISRADANWPGVAANP